jgi:hypothetical protein
MRHIMIALAGTLLGTFPLHAQESGPETGSRAIELRRQIEDRFAARVREDLGLTDRQAARMREVVGGYFEKRRGMEREERQLRQSLAGELRPGVAANQQRVGQLTDQLLELKVRYAQSYRDEVKELSGFLDPVQVAQFLILRERLFDRIREARERRSGMEGAGRQRLLRP